MIVKLQRPLSPAGEAEPPCLIYDRSRLRHWLIPLSRDRIEELLGGDDKGYFQASVEAGELVLGQRVDDQPW